MVFLLREKSCPESESASMARLSSVTVIYNSSESVSNLTVFLNSFNFHELIYLYNLVFPEAPLPPDNYTTDHLKQIIIGRVTQNMPENRFNNLFVSDEYIDLLSQYDNEDDITEDYYWGCVVCGGIATPTIYFL